MLKESLAVLMYLLARNIRILLESSRKRFLCIDFLMLEVCMPCCKSSEHAEEWKVQDHPGSVHTCNELDFTRR